MTHKFLKNWFSLLPIAIITIALIFTYCIPQLSFIGGDKEKFLKICIYLCGVVTAFWMLQHHKLLFVKKEYFRSLIVCVGAAAVFLWTYKHKITFRMDVLLLSLCALYSVVYRKWIKPDGVMITFFLLIVLKYIGILWSVDKAFAWEELSKDRMYLLLLAPLVSLGFRVKERECMSFITLCFKLFLLLLALNISLYIFAHKEVGVPFFSFFTLNKGYMNFYEHILFWTFFKHPSFIAWSMFVIWGLGVWVWRKNKAYIPLLEVVLYSLLLFGFAFIVQARVVIVGLPLGALLLGWFYFSRRWTVRKRLITEVTMFLAAILGTYLLVTHTAYFADPIREKMLTKAFDNIGTHLIIGNGTIYEKLVAQEAVGQIHIHNDFLATFIDLGIIGLLTLLLWVCFVYSKAIFTKDYGIAFCLMSFLLLMNTDVMLNYLPGIYITVPFLIFIFFKKDVFASIS